MAGQRSSLAREDHRQSPLLAELRCVLTRDTPPLPDRDQCPRPRHPHRSQPRGQPSSPLRAAIGVCPVAAIRPGLWLSRGRAVPDAAVCDDTDRRSCARCDGRLDAELRTPINQYVLGREDRQRRAAPSLGVLGPKAGHGALVRLGDQLHRGWGADWYRSCDWSAVRARRSVLLIVCLADQSSGRLGRSAAAGSPACRTGSGWLGWRPGSPGLGLMAMCH